MTIMYELRIQFSAENHRDLEAAIIGLAQVIAKQAEEKTLIQWLMRQDCYEKVRL